MYNKLVLPRNWDIVASALEFIPNAVLAGSIVDHIHLSNDVSKDARVLKDIDFEIDQQDYVALLAKCGIPYEGTPVKEIVFGDLNVHLVKFELHSSITIYQGSYKNKPIDFFVLPTKRASEVVKVGEFDITCHTVDSRQDVIASILAIEMPKGKSRIMDMIWLKDKKEKLSKRSIVLAKMTSAKEMK